MRQKLWRDETHAVTTHEYEAARQPCLNQLRQLDDFRHIRQIVAAEADRVGTPGLECSDELTLRLDLQVNDAHIVSSPARRFCHKFKSQGLEREKDASVHQPTGVNGQDFHYMVFRDWGCPRPDGSGLDRCGNLLYHYR